MMMNSYSIHSHVAHDFVCVLYSSDSGNIVFTHRFVVLGDAPRPSDEQLEKEARAALEDHRRQVDIPEATAKSLAALILPGDRLRAGHSFSVDPKTCVLVAHPRPNRAT
jgi:hypothetical protein